MLPLHPKEDAMSPLYHFMFQLIVIFTLLVAFVAIGQLDYLRKHD